ncbi:MAG TPA: aminotransferase class V-fold PLP-dependent enzyme [Candidatus Limnocylindrales bacterium]|nr:aminotransferase class V-fold PLP-dependent enzyme [Candidatus Limnocylindrales bacterium]
MPEGDPDGERDPLSVEPSTMRALGEATLAMLLEQLANPGRVPVVGGASPDEMRRRLHRPPPEHGADFSGLLNAIVEHVLPAMVRGDHPGYMAFIPGQGTWPGALGDFIASALNLYGGSWKEGAGPAQLELTVLDWFKQWIGYPETASGTLVSGGSAANMTALACARESVAGVMSDRLVIYLGDQAHSSMARAARVLGFRPEQVRILPVDERYRLRADALQGAVEADRRAGRRPFLVGAAAGSTNTGAIDPLPALAAVCKAQGLWLHVDGAYGAFATLTERGRTWLGGMELADSVTLDPHKWLYQPYECGCVLVRDGPLLRRAFAIAPDYLKEVTSSNPEVNFVDLGLQLSRATRALKVWLSVQYFGLAAFREAIDHSIDLAQRAERRIAASRSLELLSPASLSVVCFRRRFDDTDDEAVIEQRNRALLRGLEETGRAWLSSTRLRGRYAIRICVTNHNTQARHVDWALDWLERAPLDHLTAAPAGGYQRHSDLHRGRSLEEGDGKGVPSSASHLGSLVLFRDLSATALQRLAVASRELQIPAGQRIIERWDYGRELFVVLDGSALMERDDRPPRRLLAGDVFGELGALDWGAGFGYPRLATVTADAPTRVLVIPGDALNDMVRESPVFASRVEEAVRRRLAEL